MELGEGLLSQLAVPLHRSTAGDSGLPVMNPLMPGTILQFAHCTNSLWVNPQPFAEWNRPDPWRTTFFVNHCYGRKKPVSSF